MAHDTNPSCDMNLTEAVRQGVMLGRRCVIRVGFGALGGVLDSKLRRPVGFCVFAILQDL